MLVGLTASCELLAGGGGGVLAIFVPAHPTPNSSTSITVVVKPLALNVKTFPFRRALRRQLAQLALVQNVDEQSGRVLVVFFHFARGPHNVMQERRRSGSGVSLTALHSKFA